MLKVDKRKLSCFGYFDSDFLACIECCDNECRKATVVRIALYYSGRKRR